MPRRKTTPPVEAAAATSAAIAEPTATPAASEGRTGVDAAESDVPANDGTGKGYGPPYKAIFTSADKAFELGENRRYRQRVFTFKEKPDQPVIDRLKEHGFVYRAAEKAWTVEATAESRVLTDRLAREFAGQGESRGRG